MHLMPAGQACSFITLIISIFIILIITTDSWAILLHLQCNASDVIVGAQNDILLMMMQIQGHVQKLLTAAVRPRLKWDCPVNCFPSHWAPQQSNTELFEVDLASPEIASLMEAMHDLAPVTIVKVHPLKLDPRYTLGPLLCTDDAFMHSLLAFDCFCVCCSIHRVVHLRAPIDICSVCASGYCIPSVHQAILLGP